VQPELSGTCNQSSYSHADPTGTGTWRCLGSGRTPRVRKAVRPRVTTVGFSFNMVALALQVPAAATAARVNLRHRDRPAVARTHRSAPSAAAAAGASTPPRLRTCAAAVAAAAGGTSYGASSGAWRGNPFATFCDAALARPAVADGLRILEQRHPELDPSMIMFAVWLATRRDGDAPAGRFSRTTTRMQNGSRLTSRVNTHADARTRFAVEYSLPSHEHVL